MKLFYISIFVLTFLLQIESRSQDASGQNTTPITGSVIDVETQESLPGVNISIKGVSLGTVTDLDGKFSITPKQLPATIVFSLTGFRSQEVEVFEPSTEELTIEL